MGEHKTLKPLVENLCIYNAGYRENTLKFLNDLMIVAGVRRESVILDLTEIQDITAAAAVILFANVTSCQIMSGNPAIVKVLLPKKKALTHIIRSTGLWESLKPGATSKLDSLWDKKSGFQSGYDPNVHLNKTLDTLQGKVGQLPDRLGIAIQEAMLNVAHHAYNKLKISGNVRKRWWQYAYIREESNSLVYIIYDRGAGVVENLSEVGVFRRDDELIEYAMTKGVTSTKIPGRGLGSVDMKKPVRIKDNEDTLLVISGRGWYKYSSSSVEKSIMPSKVTGTLVEWELLI